MPTEPIIPRYPSKEDIDDFMKMLGAHKQRLLAVELARDEKEQAKANEATVPPNSEHGPLVSAEADSALTDWPTEWTPGGAANFFAIGECDDDCGHPHSHFENLRAGVYDLLDALEDKDDPAGRIDLLQSLREDLIAIFGATAAHVAALSAEDLKPQLAALQSVYQAAVDSKAELEGLRQKCITKACETGLEYYRTVESQRARNESLSADLFRLCGPKCEHDGRRAVEHTVCGVFGGVGRCFSPAPCALHCRLIGIAMHPPAPEIEEWLRTRGAR
jgi:hypothetical protein